MAAALACDPSVITDVNQTPVGGVVANPPESNAPMTTPALVATPEPIPLAATKTVIPTVDIAQLPSIQDMVNELRSSGILTAQTTLPPTSSTNSTKETQIFPQPGAADPTQSILLANTAPSYQRPTAANLLSEAAEPPKPSPLRWFLPLSFLCLLGAAGVMMYIQMRSTGTVRLPQFLGQ